MKRIALSALALVALTGAASAFDYNVGQVSNLTANEVRQFAPNADLSQATPSQVIAIENVLHSDDGAKGAKIRAILLN